MVKIICAGYPKTGTKSLHEALEILGYGNINDYLEHIDLYMDDYMLVLKGERKMRHVIDKYAENKVDVVIDMPPCFLFEQFFERWPTAKVILTIRDEDAWFKSIKKMNDTMVGSNFWMTYLSNRAYQYDYFQRTLYQSMLGSGSENEWMWKLHYRRHNCYVKNTIPQDQLLIYKVSDGWEPLCKFLGKEVPDERFPMVNVAGKQGNILEQILNETELARRARREIVFNITLGSLFIASCGVGGWFYYKHSC